MVKKKSSKQSHHAVANAMLVLVLVVAFIGMYYMYANAGRAFLQAPNIDRIDQRLPEPCCCSTKSGKLFEVTAQVLKGADEMQKVIDCREECEGPAHSSESNPAFLLKPGRCAFPKK